MEKQCIITIGREFGSGGHEIAAKLAERYGLPLYDYNLLNEVALKRNLTEEQLVEMEEYDEKERNIFWSRTVKGFSNSPEATVAKMQFELLRDWAKEGKSFVVVGRCSDEILRDCENAVSIFINSTELFKIERVMRIYDLSELDAISKMKTADKKRREYHDSYCKFGWGKASSYDLCINSSYLGVDGTVDALAAYIEARVERFA